MKSIFSNSCLLVYFYLTLLLINYLTAESKPIFYSAKNPQILIEVSVVGGGSWATALVKILTENKIPTYWYLRRKEQVKHVMEHGSNPSYLQQVKLDLLFTFHLITCSKWYLEQELSFLLFQATPCNKSVMALTFPFLKIRLFYLR